MFKNAQSIAQKTQNLSNKKSRAEILREFGHINMEFLSYEKLLFIFWGKRNEDEIAVFIGDDMDTVYRFIAKKNMSLEELMKHAHMVYINGDEVWNKGKRDKGEKDEY